LRCCSTVKRGHIGQLGDRRISVGLCRITKQNDTTKSRQDWGRARVNAGVVAEAKRELKLSGDKTGLNYHPRNPVPDMPTQARPFWASSVHAHLFGFKPNNNTQYFLLNGSSSRLPIHKQLPLL